ncbi:MAG: hypothetical protein ABDH63_03755 [Candidatus Caldarchaeales archaeon]
MVMGLKVYRVRLRFESPVALPTRRARLGYLGVPRYVPASTLRGAIVSSLYREGHIDEDRLKREALYPEIVASPAYPVVEGLESKPAHPFMFACKRCEAEGKKETLTFEADAVKIVKSGDVRIPEPKCGHRALKQLHPSPVVWKNGRPVEAGLAGLRYVSLNMSRRRASGIKGALYSYEALADSLEFWATVSSRDELRLKGMLLLIGRGISRGFGRVRVTEATEVNIAKEAEELKERSKGSAVFLSFSPLLGFGQAGSEWSTYPRVLDLSELAREAGSQASGTITVKRAYGRTFTFDSGWDMAKGRLRPRFEAKNPGTVVYASIDNASGDIGSALVSLRYVGTKVLYGESTWITGVNMMEPMEARE